jgi:hypothetical protein
MNEAETRPEHDAQIAGLESNARELEAALLMVRKLPQDARRGLLDVVTRYACTCCTSSSRTIRLPMATGVAAPSCSWIS